jgi:hypothetical protein
MKLRINIKPVHLHIHLGAQKFVLEYSANGRKVATLLHNSVRSEKL